jgi:2-amino-4-hydroxy-6-hydroxymethyldihydropteridine diphosphokinase
VKDGPASTLPLVAIALGSNLGDRRAHLEYALSALEGDFVNFRVSPFVETEPAGVGAEHQPFLNAAAVGLTQLPARTLLDRMLEIEEERGRLRPYPMAPRTLDLDLILYGNHVIDEPGLSVPHPRFRERAFVLQPLAAIAPDIVDPVTGKSVKTLTRELQQT